MDEDPIIAQRISGKSVRAMRRRPTSAWPRVNRVIDAWAETVIDDKIRKHTLVLEFARLDELQHVFYRRAIDDGDVQSGMLVTAGEKRISASGGADPDM